MKKTFTILSATLLVSGCAVAMAGLLLLKPPGGGNNFDPTMLTGKIGIFVADAANVPNVAGAVTSWTDLSGNGYTGVPSTIPPTFNASDLNGQGTISFVRANSTSITFPATNVFNASRGTTVYMVIQHDLSTVGEHIFFTGDLAADFPVLAYFTAYGAYLYTAMATTFVNAPTWVATPGTAWHIVDFEYNGAGLSTVGNSSLYFDRAQITTTSTGFNDFGHAVTIGNFQKDGSAGFAFGGKIAASIIVDHAFSGTERSNMNSWVARKYAI